ncbi:MAG: CvpA family protein [Alphaproteobacteria bacterium]
MSFIESLPFNVADVVVVLLILVSGFLAFYRGFITEALAVAGWVGAAIVTVVFYSPAQSLAQRHLADIVSLQILIDVGTGIALFVVSLLLFSLVLRGVARLVRGKSAHPLDRAFGFLFGIVRGIVLLAVVWLLITAIVPADRLPGEIREAKTLPMIKASGEILRQLAPATLRPPTGTPLEETRQHGPASAPNDIAHATLYKDDAGRSPCPCGHQGQAT